MFIIGTAGHIDHGKSSIIIRLTGIDPDRLPEEKNRGMTIDLGFAYFDTTEGKRIGIVDVPGHERFVRNMIAGAGGIDAVLMVVAADDGWMPQSQEHLQITRLLGVKYGIIALSKIDLVEPSWAELVAEDIKDKVRGTFLESAPIVRVSSETGEGFDRLKKEVETLAQKMAEREDIGKPRLYCDRSFVIQGIGGIVTGTLRGGAMSVGQEVAVYPNRRKGKVRSIQSHNEDVGTAEPGQRTAIGFTGIDREYLGRGVVVSNQKIVGAYPDDPVFAMQLELISESPIIVEDRRRLLLIVGTTEIEGEVRLYDDEPITPGQAALIYFKPFDPIMAFVGDRYIVRLPTPTVTVGGGMVLDILDRFPRKKEQENFRYLEKRLELSPENLITSELEKKKHIRLPDDFHFSDFCDSDLESRVKKMESEGVLEKFAGKYFDKELIKKTGSKIIANVEKMLALEPHRDGLPIDIIQDISGFSPDELDTYLEYLSASGKVIKKGNRYDLPERKLEVKGELKRLADTIEKELLADRFSPPRLSEISRKGKAYNDAVRFLINAGIVVNIGNDIVFHKEAWDEIIDRMRDLLNSRGEFAVGDLRDRLNTTRKYIVPILEETDRIGITLRDGDRRIKGEHFE